MGVLKGLTLRRSGCKEKMYILVFHCLTTGFMHCGIFMDSNDKIDAAVG